MATVADLLRRGNELPGDSPRRDAEVLLCHVLERDRSYLYAWPEAEVSSALEQRYQALLSARQRGEPVAYLIGYREFWSLDLRVNAHTLIPRPETETLVEWALSLSLPPQARVLDLGTGTGAIALALAKERPEWDVLATDASAPALHTARLNARDNALTQVRFCAAHWLRPLQGQWHLIASNPPYIDPDDAHLQQGDLRFEPSSALAAGEAGLADLRELCETAPAQLVPGGWLLMEHGFEQGAAVRELLQAQGFARVTTRRDAAGLERITGGQWPA